MGYLTKDIAEITEPKLISLSGVPNFVQFANKPLGEKTYQELMIEVNQGITQFEGSLIYIYDKDNVLHWFIGVTDSDKAGTYENGGLQFYLSSDLSVSAENFRQALLSESWFSDYYDVTIPFNQNGSEIKNGTKLSNVRLQYSSNVPKMGRRACPSRHIAVLIAQRVSASVDMPFCAAHSFSASIGGFLPYFFGLFQSRY